MVEMIVIGAAAFFVSGLTLYSGFGLGTLLMPVFALFFPVEMAVAATAVVHMANNALKLPLFGRGAAWNIILRFGLPAIAAAFLGAAFLKSLAHLPELARYELFGREAVVTPIKAVMGALILFFALFELLPWFKNLRFGARWLPLGGALSGFFGGLSGHQGALRSAFLVRTGISTGQFVGTTAVIGFAVDIVRLGVYGATFMLAALPAGSGGWNSVLVAILCAFGGLLLARRFLHKVTMATVQNLTGALLLLIALLLGSGLI